ncbi:MAG: CHAT domain-containing protein [Anaerolineae bacterium]|nr:CHAT domain-containing protein [Anaerolineae bacterium]
MNERNITLTLDHSNLQNLANAASLNDSLDITGESYTVRCVTEMASQTAPLSVDALPLDQAVEFAHHVSQGSTSAGEAQDWGQRLYTALIGDHPWASDVEGLLNQGDYLHIRLDVRAPALRPLLWELIYHDQFLSLLPQVRLSRIGPQPLQRAFGRPVQIVVLAANIPQFQANQEAEAIYSVLNQAQREGQVFVRPIDYPPGATLAQTLSRMQIAQCDILHLIGHIEVSENQPWFYLDAQPAPFRDLIQACQTLKPQVVYFSACNGTAVPNGDPARSPAYLLQQQANVPVVIGPYGTTTVWSSQQFAVEFYRALVSGLNAAAAVARARRQLYMALQESPGRGYAFDWAGPLLYQSDDKGFALTMAGQPVQETPVAKTPAASHMAVEDAFDSIPEVFQSINEIVSLPATTWVEAMPTVTQLDSESPPPIDAALPGLSDEIRALLQTHIAQDTTLDALNEVLHRPNAARAQKETAIEALGLLGQQQAMARRLLINLATDQADEQTTYLRRKAVEQLGSIRDQSALDALLIATTDPDGQVRAGAQKALNRASHQASTQRRQGQLLLPIPSTEATRQIAPLRQAVSTLKSLAPRERIDLLKQVETLRFELMRPQSRPEQIESILQALSALSPEVKSIIMALKGQIEWSPEPATMEQKAEGGAL